jgi:4-aminobutyrate aminotransferase/(S)-3-amino-2-methylpropionate transaminase
MLVHTCATPSHGAALCFQAANKPVAAMIVEPVLAEGGDKHASPDFFRKLRALCKWFSQLVPARFGRGS